MRGGGAKQRNQEQLFEHLVKKCNGDEVVHVEAELVVKFCCRKRREGRGCV